MKDIIDSRSLSQLMALMMGARKVAITCHLSPDGDAMGSSLGLCRVLRNMGVFATVITPDCPPKYLTFLPGVGEIVAFSRYEAKARQRLMEADLIFCLDYNDPHRIDLLAPLVLGAPAPRVMIDHHLDPDPKFAQVMISHPEVSSTSMLVYRVVRRIRLLEYLDREACECLFTGMMTDTGNFSYNSNDAALYEAVADFIERGIDKDWIYRKVYYSNSVDKLRLNGFALSQRLTVYPEHRASIITLTRQELNEYHYQRGDTEGLVNQPLTVPEIVYSVYLREEADYIKVSMRSKGDFPVNHICEKHFGGGGHENAAGGEYHGSMEECVEAIKALMPEYDHLLPAGEQENRNI